MSHSKLYMNIWIVWWDYYSFIFLRIESWEDKMMCLWSRNNSVQPGVAEIDGYTPNSKGNTKAGQTAVGSKTKQYCSKKKIFFTRTKVGKYIVAMLGKGVKLPIFSVLWN